MNDLKKAYKEIENWHYIAEQEGIADKKEISYLYYVKEYINNLQIKIKRANELIYKAMMERDITGNGTLNLNELLDIFKEEE